MTEMVSHSELEHEINSDLGSIADIGTVQFYGADMAFYTAKLRPFFLFKHLPFYESQPSLENLKELVQRGISSSNEPIVTTSDNRSYQNPVEALEMLDAVQGGESVIPSTALHKVTSYIIELYADEFLLLPALHYRWRSNQNSESARHDLKKLLGDKYQAESFASDMTNDLPLLGINDSTAPLLEEHVHELLEILNYLLSQHDYLLGGHMSLADLSMMGPLYSHFYIDPGTRSMLEQKAPAVCEWIERMNRPEPVVGVYLEDDALPESIIDLLRLIARDALPMFLSNAHAFDEWATVKKRQLDILPRAVGMYQYNWRGVKVERIISTSLMWRIQRPIDVSHQLDRATRKQVMQAYQGIGVERLLDYRMPNRVRWQGDELFLED